MSRDCATALQPHDRVRLSQNKTKQKRKKEREREREGEKRKEEALREAEAGSSLEVRSLRPAWPTWSNPVSTENTKISQAWWHTPILPATWEAELEGLLELKAAPSHDGATEFRPV